MNRGNRKAIIFDDDRDRRRFLRILAESVQEYQVEVLSGSLMGTHFHLIVLTPHGNVSEFMQQLEGRYAQYSNWRHGRVGHLFQARFKGVLIENDIHLFTAFWYVAMNPVVARFVARAEDWKWSSYGATVGLQPVPPYLSISWLQSVFPAASLSESQRLCRACMEDARPIHAYLQAVNPTTEAAIRSYVAERLHQVPQPCEYGTLMRPPIERLFPDGQSRPDLESAIVVAHETHGFKIAEIARCISKRASNVSKIYCSQRRRTQAKSGSDPTFDT